MEEEQKINKRPSSFPLFSKYLALQPQTTVDYANQCKKHFEQFNQAFKKRITIQLEYAKNLQIVSKSLDKYIQPGTQKALSFICSAFKVEHQQRAHQAKQLAESLRTEIYQICLNLQRQQSIIVKRIQKDVKKYLKQYELLQQQYQSASQNYEKYSKIIEQQTITKNYLKYSSEMPQQKKIKLISKAIQSIKQKKQYEKSYIIAYRNCNEFAKQYNIRVTEDLNKLQNQIREQIILEADCLRKLIICEVSMFKNIQYDLINISKQMELLDTQKDVEIITNENKNLTENFICDAPKINGKQKSKITQEIASSKPNDQQPVLLLTSKQYQIDKNMMSTCLKNIQDQTFIQKLQNKKNKSFKLLIQSRWQHLNQVIQNEKEAIGDAGENTQVNTQKNSSTLSQPSEKPENLSEVILESNLRQHFDSYFKDSIFQKQFLKDKKQEEKDNIFSEIYDNFIIITRYINQVWNGQNITLIQSKKKNKDLEQPLLYIKKTLSNHFYRIISYTYIQKFRAHQKVAIENSSQAKQIGKFINSLITKSHKDHDAFILRGILGLIFTFYWIDNNNNKKFLYNDALINKNSIWKKPEFWDAVIYESTYEQMLGFGSQKVQSIPETVQNEKNLIFSQLASYCHYMIMLGIVAKSVRHIVGRYCRLYGMTNEQNNDLSKMITNTITQYKDIMTNYIKENKNDQGEN